MRCLNPVEVQGLSHIPLFSISYCLSLPTQFAGFVDSILRYLTLPSWPKSDIKVLEVFSVRVARTTALGERIDMQSFYSDMSSKLTELGIKSTGAQWREKIKGIRGPIERRRIMIPNLVIP